jgi:asparagine synthase (glutamine-hydrolysing)
MCGIVGVASTKPVADKEWLVPSRDSLRHRGPDGAGVWWSTDGRVGLAHRLLGIIDLSPAGVQPMHLDHRGLSIVFNGEIYNYRELRKELSAAGHTFRSDSDTEVYTEPSSTPRRAIDSANSWWPRRASLNAALA